MLKIILFISLLFSVLIGFSQNRVVNFSNDSIEYFDQLTDFMTYSRLDDGKYAVDEFSWDWYGGMFSEKQKEQVYKMSNVMLKKKKPAFPDFQNYLLVLSGFVNNDAQTEESFKAWHDILMKLSKKRGRKDFTKFLKSSSSLMKKNILFESTINKWKSNNKNFSFGIDSLPHVKFDALTLTCYSKGDSSVILNTKGIYYPTLNKWIGEGGKLTWERAGFSADSVYAEFNNYQIILKSPVFKIKDAIFYNLHYFKTPLKGRLYDKVLANVVAEKATYPRFDSYDVRLDIKDISKGVDYNGGFSLYGRKVLGKGTKEEDAYIMFKRKDKSLLKMSAKTFIIKPKRIVSEIASATIYLEKDSIYHPGLSFKFFIKERKVALIRDNKGIKITPYFNSYHQVDMKFEVLNWNLDDPKMEFKNLSGGTKTDATFVSSDYFRMNAYMSMMGMESEHPLYRVKSLVDKLDTNFITVEDLARHTRLSREQLTSMLLNLSNQGFILFDYEAQNFIVKDRLINWVKASGGNVDYDVIGFYSKLKGASNATLSLINYDMTMRGVNSVVVSDSQEVTIYPANRELILKKNRDFTFSGAVQAGRFDVMGSNFKFMYDEFKIDMPNVDSLRIYAETGEVDQYGKPVLKAVKTVMEKINGDLIIDKQNNKSGVKLYEQYPIFNSYKDAYVFYDRNEIQGGVYKRDDFYFHVEPFTIDSLDNFNNDALKFKGTFLSAGIFPDIDETLTLQPDHSLGFVKKTPAGGMPMYGGKGTFTDDIKMSHKGLKGDGSLKYITSTTYSNDFTFFPDSMNAIAQNYNVEESPVAVEFPPVEGENVQTRWYPKEDYMTHQKIDKAIAMYDMKSLLHGTTITRPEGLSGLGIFAFEKAELESNLIQFKFNEFQADTADFRLKDTEVAGALAFATNNVNAYVSFAERFGQFKSNGGGSFIEFPQNEYICFMEEFKWFMDNDDIEMTAGEQKTADASGVKLDGAQFISVHPDQDSLSFFSSKAKYDLKKKIINAEGVKYMNIADAMLYPDSGKVVVLKKAKMKTLNNARIVASYITQNHTIYNSTINVSGKKRYSGTGSIDYVDEVNTTQIVFLENIGVDTTGQTYATGTIEDSAQFTLSPNFEYKGKLKLFANNEYLTFDGTARIKHDCDLLSKDWFTFESEIDPNEIYIPIDSTTKSLEGGDLFTSVFLSPDSLGVYSSFLNRRKKYSHTQVVGASGYLFYDKASTEYRVSNKDKLQEMSFGGNYLSLNTKNCKVYGEGKINLGDDLGQVNINSAGNIQHNQLDNEAIFDLVTIFDFFFTEDGLKKMSKHMQESSSLDPAKLDRPTFEKGLREVIGKIEADKLIAQANLYGEFKKVPDALRKSLVFNDLKMRWHDASRSFKSFGKIGVSNIGKEQVNKYVNGKVQIIKKRSGDVLTIYLEIDKNNWYFFTYTRGLMQAISSNVEFNTAIQEVKPDKRKSKAAKGQQPYQYMYSTERKKRDFLRKFEN